MNPTSNLYLSTHPSNLERMETAKQFGKNHYQATSCMASNSNPEPVSKSVSPELMPEPQLLDAANDMSLTDKPFFFGWL